jgi:hypothetical protein
MAAKKKEDIAVRALEEIVRLDFNRNEDGSTNLYSGAPNFVRAWLFAREALDKLKETR